MAEITSTPSPTAARSGAAAADTEPTPGTEVEPTRGREIREQIIRRVEGICGLQVTEVNIAVADLHFAGEDDRDAESA